MGRPRKKFKFTFPQGLRNPELVKAVVGPIIDQIAAERDLSAADIPHFHRMATSYDCYLWAEDECRMEGLTMINKKGETVKHPAVNISRENWGVFMSIAREYGITPKSKAQMSSHKAPLEKADDELTAFEQGR